MKKEKCDCEYKMLAALAVGVGLGLVCGLAIGWNGAKYPSDTSFILAFLTALGTVATAIGAVWISYNGQRRYERDKLLDKRYYLEGVVLPALTTTQKNLTDQQILNNRDVDSKYAHALNELARLDSINTFSAIRDEISLVKKIIKQDLIWKSFL